MPVPLLKRRHAVTLGTLLAALVLWEILIGYFQVIAPYLLPPPSDILAALQVLLGTDSFVNHMRVTARRVVIASVLAAVPGVILGLAMGWSPTVKALSFPVVSATYPLPKVSLLPLFMLIFGRGELSFVLIIAIAATFLVLFNAMRGVDAIGNLYFEVARDNGITSSYVYFKEILLPGALPMIFTGLRLTLNTALLVTISVEFVAAQTGLGSFIWQSWGTLQTARMYAAVLLVMLAGILITYGLEWAAIYAMPWKTESAATAGAQ